MGFLAVATFLCFWVSVIFALFAAKPRLPMAFVVVWGTGLLLVLAFQLNAVVFVLFQAVLAVLLLLVLRQERDGLPAADGDGEAAEKERRRKGGSPPREAGKEDRDEGKD